MSEKHYLTTPDCLLKIEHEMIKSLLISLTFILFLSLGLLITYFFQLGSNNQLLKDSTGNLIQVTGRNLVNSPINAYYATGQVKSQTLAAISKSDSRPVIINNFLATNKSPMAGLGDIFVATADKYGLDYRLIPAIAFQESTLGKNMPKGSHNAFGWAVYTGANSGARFHDWQFAIDTVAAGIKKDYVDRGLTSVEAIMSRYTPDSNGDWAFGVNFAINEMTPQ